MPGIRDVNVNLAAQGERFSIMLTLTYGPLPVRRAIHGQQTSYLAAVNRGGLRDDPR